MEIQEEKVYVAVGKDVQEGMGTLQWALKNWSSQSISIVIVHVNTSTNDLVDTPCKFYYIWPLFFSHLLSIIFFFFPPFSWLEFQWVICFLLDGKLPARSVSDEGLEFFRTYGKDKTDKLFSKYKAFCGKVRTVADLDTHCLLQS